MTDLLTQILHRLDAIDRHIGHLGDALLKQGETIMANMADLDAALGNHKTAIDNLAAAIMAIPPAVVDTSAEVQKVQDMMAEVTDAMSKVPHA